MCICGGHGQSLYRKIDRKNMYGTMWSRKYSRCSALVKDEGTYVLLTIPLSSHNPINGGNANREGGNGSERKSRERQGMDESEGA